jgi:hypothetical protein
MARTESQDGEYDNFGDVSQPEFITTLEKFWDDLRGNLTGCARSKPESRTNQLNKEDALTFSFSGSATYGLPHANLIEIEAASNYSTSESAKHHSNNAHTVEKRKSADKILTNYHNDDKLDSEHQRLTDLVALRFGNNTERLSKFKKDMADFENRMGTRASSREKVIRTFHELERMLEHNENAKTTDQQREILCEQIMHQAANTSEIRQGAHNCCGAAAVEARTYELNPDKAAALIGEVSINGYFTVKGGGGKVLIPDECIQPDAEAKNSTNPFRTYASQIFQITAENVYWQQCENSQYTQVGHGPGDTGERVIGMNGSLLGDSGGLPDGAMTEIYQDINDNQDEYFVLRRYDDNLALKIDNQTRGVGSLDDLKSALRGGDFPLIVVVNTGKEPFSKEGGTGGWHVVTIRGFDESTGKVAVDNQWGDLEDHLTFDRQIEIAMLFDAMAGPK